MNIELFNTCDKTISSYLKANKKIINETFDQIKDTELLNIKDELIGVIDKTIYLFRLE